MKPISQLKFFMQGNRTPIAVISALIKLFSNPKRHIRGPFFANTPSNGKREQPYGACGRDTAISACASGALMIMFKDDEGSTVREAARTALERAATRLFETDMIDVSDASGRAAFLRVAKAARKDLRAG